MRPLGAVHEIAGLPLATRLTTILCITTKMVNITLSIPEDLHRKLKKHSEIRWSEVVRKALAEKVADLEYMDRISSKSRLTLREAEEFSDKVSASAAEKFMKLKKSNTPA